MTLFSCVRARAPLRYFLREIGGLKKVKPSSSSFPMERGATHLVAGTLPAFFSKKKAGTSPFLPLLVRHIVSSSRGISARGRTRKKEQRGLGGNLQASP